MLTITFSYPAIIKNKGTARFHKFIKYPGTSAVSVCPQPNQQTPSSFCRRGYASAESLDRPTSLPGCSCLSAYMHVPSPEAPTSPSDQNVETFVWTPMPRAVTRGVCVWEVTTALSIIAEVTSGRPCHIPVSTGDEVDEVDGVLGIFNRL